jgi:hypothetical protein
MVFNSFSIFLFVLKISLFSAVSSHIEDNNECFELYPNEDGTLFQMTNQMDISGIDFQLINKCSFSAGFKDFNIYFKDWKTNGVLVNDRNYMGHDIWHKNFPDTQTFYDYETEQVSFVLNTPQCETDCLLVEPNETIPFGVINVGDNIAFDSSLNGIFLREAPQPKFHIKEKKFLN